MSNLSSAKPLVVSFYTENTPYQIEAFRLLSSCNEFEVEAEIDGVPSLGSWARNCAIKPFFMRDKLKLHKRPIFWVDVDAAFCCTPNFSTFLSFDLVIRQIERFKHDARFRFFTGSLFMNYTPAALEFVDAWCNYCEKALQSSSNCEYLDQISLVHVMDGKHALRIDPLPIAYAKIFDIDAELIDPSAVVIEHHQASRRYRGYYSQ